MLAWGYSVSALGPLSLLAYFHWHIGSVELLAASFAVAGLVNGAAPRGNRRGCQCDVGADRGFGDHKLYAFLQALGWDFVIRFRAGIAVQNAAGETPK